MDAGWVVMVQKLTRDGGFGAPEILGQKVYTDRVVAESVRDSAPNVGGLSGAHAYLVPVGIKSPR